MNDTANFDPESFLHDEVDGEMSTRGLPVPEGDYQGVITALVPRSGSTEKGEWHALDVTWEVLNRPEIQEQLGRTPTVRQRVFMDLDAGGRLSTEKGKNTGLGRVREATGSNNPGPFKLQDLIGRTGTISVTHRMHEGEIYDEVKRVAAPQS